MDTKRTTSPTITPTNQQFSTDVTIVSTGSQNRPGESESTADHQTPPCCCTGHRVFSLKLDMPWSQGPIHVHVWQHAGTLATLHDHRANQLASFASWFGHGGPPTTGGGLILPRARTLVFGPECRPDVKQHALHEFPVPHRCSLGENYGIGYGGLVRAVIGRSCRSAVVVGSEA